MTVVRRLVNMVSYQEDPTASSESVKSDLADIRKFATRAVAGIAGFGAVVGGIAMVGNQMELLNNQLITLVGSEEEANRQMEKLKEFAAQTPFDFKESIASFIKLQQVGIDASMERLRAFGDAAAAQGASFTKMTESIRKAALGQRESLKENFGIIVSEMEGKDGLQVAYKDTVKTVEDSKESIAQAVQEIAEEHFEGGMGRMMDMLSTQITLIGDELQKTANKIAKAGLQEELKTLVVFFRELFTGGDQSAEAIGKSLADATETFVDITIAAVKTVKAFIDGLSMLGVEFDHLITLFQIWLGMQILGLFGSMASAALAAIPAITGLGSAWAWLTGAISAANLQVYLFGAAVIAALLLLAEMVAFFQGKKNIFTTFFQDMSAEAGEAFSIILTGLGVIAGALAVAFSVATAGWFLLVAGILLGIGWVYTNWDWLTNQLWELWDETIDFWSRKFWDFLADLKWAGDQIEKWFDDWFSYGETQVDDFVDSAREKLDFIPGIDGPSAATRAAAGGGAVDPAGSVQQMIVRRKREREGTNLNLRELNISVPKAESGTPEDQAKKTREETEKALMNLVRKADEDLDGGPR